MELRLDGKAAIVTGGARGVGQGVATALVKAGAQVLIVDRDEATGQEAARALCAIGRAAFLPFDLARHEALDEVVAAALSAFGRLDILVNCAQAAQLLPLAETTNEAMHLAFDTPA